MSQTSRIYLDNAATSWPKPEAVLAVVENYFRELGAPAGRSAYREASQVERMILSVRQSIAELLGAKESKRIIFTFNGTDSLNLAIHGILRPGDHVVTSVVEHNSVLRPLRELEESGTIQVTRIGCDALGVIDPGDVQAALRTETRLVVLVHASNVTGAVQPVAEVGKIVRDHDAFFLVDAAQTLGHLPVSVDQIQADLLAAPGHKGLLGPLGTGLLYIGPNVEDQLRSIRQGGTGTQSQQDRQPLALPEKYESGNLNVPGILGLGAGIESIKQRGLDDLHHLEMELTEQLLAGLSTIRGVRLYGPKDTTARVGVVSMTLDQYDPQELAGTLDAVHRIQARSGMHCAPRMHVALGTDSGGGTLRFSLGPSNTPKDIDVAVKAMDQIASATLA